MIRAGTVGYGRWADTTRRYPVLQRRVDAAFGAPAGRGRGPRHGCDIAGARVLGAEVPKDAARHRLTLDLLDVGPCEEAGLWRVGDEGELGQGAGHARRLPEHVVVVATPVVDPELGAGVDVPDPVQLVCGEGPGYLLVHQPGQPLRRR